MDTPLPLSGSGTWVMRRPNTFRCNAGSIVNTVTTMEDWIILPISVTVAITGTEMTRPITTKGYTTDLIGQEAARIIEDHDKDKPLFLYVPFNAPHSPYQATL